MHLMLTGQVYTCIMHTYTETHTHRHIKKYIWNNSFVRFIKHIGMYVYLESKTYKWELRVFSWPPSPGPTSLRLATTRAEASVRGYLNRETCGSSVGTPVPLLAGNSTYRITRPLARHTAPPSHSDPERFTFQQHSCRSFATNLIENIQLFISPSAINILAESRIRIRH